jgi:hypothetical protein
MSLPSSERLPSDINDLPPARQRHIRRQPRSVSLAERQILVDSLIKLTAPTPAFFTQAILGALALGGALYLQNIALLIVAIVIFPFQAPLFGLALYPLTLNIKHAVKSLISLLLLILFTFGAGALAGVFQPVNYPDPLGLYRSSSLYWLDLTIVVLSAFLSALTLLRQGKAPQGMGALLSYTLLVPFAVIGFGLSNGLMSLWTGALFVGFAHLGLAAVLAVFTFVILGFPPKKALGWLVLIAALALTLAVISAGLNYSVNASQVVPPAAPSPTRLSIPSESPAPPTEPSPTDTSTPTDLPPTATQTSSPSPASTATLTPQPVVRWGVVDSAVGAVIRGNPDFTAEIITYANNGDQIEIFGELTTLDGARWFQVLTDSGQSGWLLGSLVQTQTPAPTDTD